MPLDQGPKFSRRRESNPQHHTSEAWASASWATAGRACPEIRTRICSILSRAALPVGRRQAYLTGPPRIRTENLSGLNGTPLPVGLEGLELGAIGGIRTLNLTHLKRAPLPVGLRWHTW